MDESKRQHIITEVAEALRRGDNTDELFETYLYRCMFLYRNPLISFLFICYQWKNRKTTLLKQSELRKK